MKKILSLFILVLVLISFTGCNDVDLSTTSRVIPPKVAIPVHGIWKVESYAFSAMSKMGEEGAKAWIGKKAYFNEQKIVLPDDNCEKPEFKIKSVDTNTYLYNNYKSSMKSMNINQSEMKIITITSNKNYFRDIIKIDDSRIIIIKDGVFFFLSKQSNENKISVEDIENGKKLSYRKLEPYTKGNQSGLLLGLKYYKNVDYKLPYVNENKTILEPVYRTLWISYDGSVEPISELPFLFVPRRTGFWKLQVSREITDNYGVDSLLAAPVGKEIKKTGIKVRNADFYDFKSINFVGNDYVCYERDIESDKQLNASHLLEVVPLDTIYTGSEVPIVASKVLGEKGIEGLNSGAKSYLRTILKKDKDIVTDTPLPTSFGIFRKNGKWLLRGRLNFSEPTVKNEYADFNVPIEAPENLVNYDSLFPSWEVIKQKVPNALDAYTSPNKDIVVVLTNSKLAVYAIKDNILGAVPLKELQLKNSEVSVMAQWATDDYVKIWSEDVKKVQGK
ncbi:hypothetical protein [Clostridium tagluense]|uniref:hypothetical protein n=1 Tax=Clostridium tagluense TaxID=360422 RepID=UPI001C6E510F|nr:hypothetical protein [Clostridium tagluense]MBW9157436.1 hypothetical protein [Clostridium tagluense]WLC66698.1 hypothetical protein KTC93_05770 [Clostridium tagluense]